MRMRNLILPLAALSLVWSGCVTARSRKTKPLEAEEKPAVAQSTAPVHMPEVDEIEASLRGVEFKSVPDLETIRFDYDSAILGDEALLILKKNAEFIKAHKNLEALVAGHCDERGTVEYNLALGQKRAKEVRDYYIRLGIADSSLATISYGKEQPLCGESTEECWGRNRRGETTVRARASTP